MTRTKPPDSSCKCQQEQLARLSHATLLSGGCSGIASFCEFLPLALLVLTHPACVYHSRTDCNTSAPLLALTSINSPLPDKAFNADISLPYGLPQLKAGQTEFISVLVRNNSDVVWPAIGQREARHAITNTTLNLALTGLTLPVQPPYMMMRDYLFHMIFNLASRPEFLFV